MHKSYLELAGQLACASLKLHDLLGQVLTSSSVLFLVPAALNVLLSGLALEQLDPGEGVHELVLHAAQLARDPLQFALKQCLALALLTGLLAQMEDLCLVRCTYSALHACSNLTLAGSKLRTCVRELASELSCALVKTRMHACIASANQADGTALCHDAMCCLEDGDHDHDQPGRGQAP